MATDRVTVEDVAQLIRKQLGRKFPEGLELGPDSDLEGLGLSSLDQTEVFFAVEEKVGMELDPTAGADVTTIGELVGVVNSQIEQQRPQQPTAAS
ncbi:MAG: acyl carrier protein [Thermoleophilaceae bacterium]|nr:acyl carrier protein [Thermoleophilaceae bacterium]